MMKLLEKYFFILSLISVSFNAQDKEFIIDPTTTEEEVTKKHSSIDKNAEAEILYSKTFYDIDKDFQTEKKVFMKVKIYQKNRVQNWLNVQIPVTGDERITQFLGKVSTYKNGTVLTTFTDKNEQLKENLVKGVKIYKLAFPSVEDGSVIEYSYTISNAHSMQIVENLEFDIPVVYKVFHMEYPETLFYSFTHMGKMLQPSQKSDKSVVHVGGSHKITKMLFENIPSVKAEEYVKNMKNYRASLKPQMRSLQTNLYSYESFNDWSEASKKLQQNDNFGNYLKGNPGEIFPVDAKGITDKKKKADYIFNFVKKNFKWNNSNAIVSSQPYRQFIKSKAGNSADLNLFLITLLRFADIEAHPVLISTVSNGLLNYLDPSLSNVDKVLASVKIDNDYFFYDATSFASQANILPEEDWNYNGVMLLPKKALDISFANTSLSTTEEYADVKINVENSNISGNLKKISSAMFAINEFENFDLNNSKYNELFKALYALNISSVNSKLLEDGKFESSMKYSSDSHLDVIGKKIIFNPLLFFAKSNESFEQTTQRQFDIDFPSPFQRSKVVEIEIPEDYQVDTMPRNKFVETDDREISFKYNCELIAGNKLKVFSTIKVSSESYPKEYYPIFKQIWKTISDTENQVISLIKK
ncbi:transglutaminase-like domain-containing protein [Chryseobacterium sp.]|uniref:transglutaminase-like domain-containing protein n=1 Tax=Chryseobacterium sp. TaxID=1871047 RepID=UPI0028A16D45|nr:transglutaminase-like domain-containing protein [Chryseobacterium sp.]